MLSAAGVTVHTLTSEIWEYFNEHKDRLSKEQILICENANSKSEIYLTEDAGYPLFLVYQYDVLLYKEPAISKTDCESAYKLLCMKYIFPQFVLRRDEDDVADDIDDDIDDIIAERDESLYCAMEDALTVFLGVSGAKKMSEEYGEDIVEDCVDIFCRALAQHKQISVYRPTWETDKKTKREILVKYPYLDVDGEENDPPIYREKKKH